MKVPEFLQLRSVHLLGSLVLLVLFHPLIDLLPEEWNERVLAVLITAVLLTAVWWSTGERRHRILAVMLFLPGLASVWLGKHIGTPAVLIWEVPLLYVIGQLIHSVLLGRMGYVDRIVTGISVYLLLALSFSNLHLVVMKYVPGAYEFPGPVVGDGTTDMLYFSLVTILTLGYGDIVPVDPFARMLTVIEAFVGSFFVAILIARLVTDTPRPSETAPGGGDGAD